MQRTHFAESARNDSHGERHRHWNAPAALREGCRRLVSWPRTLIACAILLEAGPALSQTVDARALVLTISAPGHPQQPETGYLQMGSDSALRSPEGGTLAVNNLCIVRNGAPWLPVMGEFHFSRTPRACWDEELLKMKAGGVQIVSTYMFWIHHEETEGTFDWSGQRDLCAFVGLCARRGLLVYPRIGPWAHGEVRNGGFPDWLLAKSRTRVNDSTFLSCVRRFYGEIGRQLKGLLWKDGGPVIGIQIENEYANRAPDGGDAYLLTLKRMAIDAGLDVPLYTITGWDNAVIPTRAFIPVYGGYPDEAWSGSTRELAPDPQGVFQFHVASPVGTAGIMQGWAAPSDQPDFAHYPRFTAELGGGMEDTYHRRVVIAPDDIVAMTISALGSGVNLLGYYMFHGGTNPEGKLTTLQESQATGYPNDVPVKSYDFQAPLGEFGQMSPAFRKLKAIHRFVSDFGADIAAMPAVLPDIVPSGPRDTTTLRVAARLRGDSGYLFFNNYLRGYPLPERAGVQVRLRLPQDTMAVPDIPFTVPSQSSFIWPVNLDIQGARLEYATAQPCARLTASGEEYYFFIATPLRTADFVFDASTVASVRPGSGILTSVGGRTAVRGVVPSTSEAMEIVTSGGRRIHIILLSPADALNSWNVRVQGREYLLITPADVFVAGDTIHLRSRDPKTFVLSAFPAFTQRLLSSVPVRATGRKGMFEGFRAIVAPARCALSVRKIREPGNVPKVSMGPYADWRKCAVARAPEDSAFGKAGVWRLKVRGGVPPGVRELFLRIDFAGDVGRLYEGACLLDDNFFNGTVWEVGLCHLVGNPSGRAFDLRILPLRRDAPIYLPAGRWPSFHGASQIAAIRSITVAPEYDVTLCPAR